MKTKEIFRKVGAIMGELNEQYQYLSENPENLNDLELELFLANSNFLTDHIEILRKLNGSASPRAGAAREEVRPISTLSNIPEPAGPPKQETVAEEKPESLPGGAAAVPKVEKEAPEVQEAENVEENPEVEEMQDVETPEVKKASQAEGPREQEEAPAKEVAAQSDNIKPEQHIPEQEPAFKPTETPEVIKAPEPAETVKEVVIPEKTVSLESPVIQEEPASIPTINEIISAQVNSSTVGKRFTDRPVGDLKAIISLNDKLLFIKDLFNGYSLAYSEAIELINRFDSFEAADNFLKINYAAKNNWHEKQLTVDKFYDVLNRRFAR